MVGFSFFAGFLTRWAGLVRAFNFAVAVAMVDAKTGLCSAFPATTLMLLDLLLATFGAGRFAVDAILGKSQRRKSVHP